MLQPPTNFEVKFIVGLVTLTFDLLTSKMVRVIARKVGNFLNNFDVFGTFRSRLMGQANICQTDHVTMRP